MWKEKESEHYVFHYQPDSLAEAEIDEVIQLQENCYLNITKIVPIDQPNKIGYWLCNTREEVGEISGHLQPVNGITCWDGGYADIHAVYNEHRKCIGYHEDVHAITSFFSVPQSNAMMEGIAMYFDTMWWNVENELCVKLYLEENHYLSCEKMIGDTSFFLQAPDKYAYPIMGAFTKYLIEMYGIDRYLKLYQYKENDWNTEFVSVYGISIHDIEEKFVDYIKEKKYSEQELILSKQILHKE